MRAGAFAERRVIRLINRRFVPFYFNTSGPGEGKDAAAEDFVRGKTQNQWAYLAAFHPDGAYIDEPEMYADEDAVFAWLLRQLDRFPEYDALTADEESVLEAARRGSASAEERRAGADLAEQLGRVDLAEQLLQEAPGLESHLARTRIARERGDWSRHAELASTLPVGMDRAIEEAYLDLHEERWADAREALEDAIRRFPDHARHAEARCYAGKACFFLDQPTRAKYHWMWVVEHRPDDRFFMRCRIAAAADRMPYPNSLLDGYEAPVGMIGPHSIERAVLDARRVHLGYVPVFEDGRAEEDSQHPWASGAAGALVQRLRDGDDHVVANNEIVDALVLLEEEALPPLEAAIVDETFAGRGYAAFALARVLEVMPDQPQTALKVLKRTQDDEDPYVRLLSTSGLMRLKRAEVRSNPEVSGRVGTESSEEDVVALVRRLRDGNAHVPANNRIVDRLEVLGEASVRPLIDAIRDRDFEGRGYSAWALGVVLAGCGAESPAGRELLRACEEDRDDYVRVLAGSGHQVLEASDGEIEGRRIREIDSPLVLAAALRDSASPYARTTAISARLHFLGKPCIPSLKAAVDDPEFPGRVAAISVLAEIMSLRGVRDADAIRSIRKASAEGGMIAEVASYALQILRDV